MNCHRICLVRIALPLASLFAFAAAFGLGVQPPSGAAVAPQRPAAASATSTTAASPAPSTTTLSLISAGSTITSIAPGTAVTLTARVTATANAAISPGQVRFCNATAAHCEDAALLATAQLTSAGTATYKFIPGVGSHTYRAIFVGTRTYSGSASTVEALTVTGGEPVATTTTFTSSGSPGDYTLAATVAGLGTQPPTGNVTFPDTTYGNVSLGSATLEAGTPSQTFTEAQDIALLSYPAAPGDFNSDGLLDLAGVVNGSLTILLNTGGTLAAVNTYAVGTSPGAIVVADFNADGFPDVAVANQDGTVTVLLGSASGSFSYAPGVTVGSGANDIAAADFNGDGIVDLMIANSYDGNIFVVLGKGDGSFGTPNTYANGRELYQLRVADFNNDGFADLAFASSENQITILLGTGDGSFVPGTNPHLDGGVNTIVVGDFNGDGNADIAVGGSSYGGGNALTVLLGHGNGTFYSHAPVIYLYTPEIFSTADVNNDGITDLVLYLEDVSTLLGKGDGTFTAGPSFSGGGLADEQSDIIAVGDFSGDGLPDVLIEGPPPNRGGTPPSQDTLLANQLTQMATATLTHASAPAGGTQQVEASYPGDMNFLASVSSTFPLLGTQPATTLTLAAAPNPSAYGAQVTLRATLSPYASSGGTTDGEAIAFYENGAALGTGTLSSGVATLKVALLPVGADNLTAVFTSDANFAGSTSNTVVETVTAAPGPPPGFVVTVNTDDATGNQYNCIGAGSANCSLRDAVAAATFEGAGNITFSPTVFAASQPASARTISLDAVLILPSNTTITGPTTSSGTTLTQLVTLTPLEDAAFEIDKGTTHAAISGLAISGGYFPEGGGGAVRTDGELTLSDTAITGNVTGGEYAGSPAVFNDADGTLTLTNCDISGNSDFADPNGGGPGGGILNYGTLVVINSTISDNSSEDAPGGGLLNGGTATLTNTTVSGNEIFFYNNGGYGGGIYNYGTLNLVDSSVTGNSASNPGQGSGIYNTGTLHITESSITGNFTNYNETYDYQKYSPVEDDCDGPGCPVEKLPAAPVFSPPSGTYSDVGYAGVYVNITDTTPGTVIFDTTDGSTPTASSDVWFGGQPIDASTIFKSSAYSNGFSPVSTATYTIAHGECTIIDYSKGFTPTALTLNGGATVKGGLLQLTDGGSNEARSAFYSTLVPTTEFTTDFQFQLVHPLADGITLTIQSASPDAVGASGGGLGYAGIPKSVALKFDLFNNSGEGFDSSGYYFDGVYPSTPAVNLSPYGIHLHSGHTFAVHITYIGGVTTATITDLATYQSASATIPGDLSKVVGEKAYVGFTGGTGLLSATQNILTWTYGGGAGCGTLSTPRTLITRQ